MQKNPGRRCGFHAQEFLLQSVVNVKSLWALKGQTHRLVGGKLLMVTKYEESLWFRKSWHCKLKSSGEDSLYVCPILVIFREHLLWVPFGDVILHWQAGFGPVTCWYSLSRTLQ